MRLRWDLPGGKERGARLWPTSGSAAMRTDLVTTIDDRPRGLVAACWWAYEHAPACLETGLALARRYFAPWLSLRLPVRLHRLEGPQAGEIVSIGDAMTLSYLLQRLGPARIASTDHTGLIGLAASLRRAIRTRDLVLAAVPSILSGPLGRHCLRVPGLVSFRLPVEPTLEATLARATTTVRRDARRVLRPQDRQVRDCHRRELAVLLDLRRPAR